MGFGTSTPTGRVSDPTVDLRDRATVDDAVATRRSRRQLEHVESELATFVGTLRNLAERGVGLTVACEDDRRFQGVVLAVATDHVVMATPAGQRVHLLLDAVHAVHVEPEATAGIPRSSRDAAQDLLLLERMARWLDDRPDVALFLAGRPEPVSGRLVAVGEDVVTISRDHDDQPTWVAASAVRCIAIDL